GSAELARATEIGILLEDTQRIEAQFGPYKSDPDVLAIVVTDAHGAPLVLHGSLPQPLTEIFSGPEGGLSRLPNAYVSWRRAMVEGIEVGRVAVAASNLRLDEGSRLERRILLGAFIGGLLAFAAALGFVAFYVRPVIRVTQAAFARLEKTTELALQAARMKSEFLANMSHEIRTPMNGVLGMIELLNGTTLEAKQRRYTQTLQASAAALMTVLNDILDFSKMEAGKLRLQPDATELRTVVEEVAELFGARAHLRNIELACHIDRELPRFVEVDSDRLRQILSNLIGNAVKFTDHGQIVIRVKLLGPAGDSKSKRRVDVRFEVEDSGVGIDAATRGRLFEAFSQADGSFTREHGGTGLGLAICSKLVELMRGSIGVESEVGCGSTFWFVLPLEPVEMEQASERGLHLRRARTLIVDDNETNRLILEELLSSWGFPNQSVPDVDSALRALTRAQRSGEAFGLVISDMHMPEVDGLTLARHVRGSEHGDLPLILLTSQSEELPPEELDLLDGILQKPVRAEQLSSVIRRALHSGTARHSSPGESAESRTQKLAHSKILVVEDNPINQEVICEMLRELGIGAVVADHGAHALELLATHSFPVVLMDCQMPVMDGYTATREIRRRENGASRMPIIAVTAHAMQSERDKVQAAGMNDYISKPITRRALAAALQRWWPELAESAPISIVNVPRTVLPQPSSLDRAVRRSAVVIRSFVRHAPSQIEAIQSALREGDAAALKQAAHLLKGGCLAVGVPRMASLCARLEVNPVDRLELCSQLEREYAKVQARLEALLVSEPQSVEASRYKR
ncbi:MAG TPA: response regulator, partial [Polyangiaceae bacterium]|nr:response regulator [Polyangiaceae bacterium]